MDTPTPSPQPTPRFVSTRDAGHEVSFPQALLRGLAPDGGLYLPNRIPKLDPGDWREAERFPELAMRVLWRWLKSNMDSATLIALLEDALSFPVPLVALQGGSWGGVFVLELFHGPTLSFKDFGARTMARWMGHFLAGEDEHVTILVATSGDTGSAVADGFAGQERIDVVLLYPKGQVSPVQERQLIVRRPGVRAFAVEGTFDDCQRLVKAAFMDERLKTVRLSSANSINIGRLLPQMLYYIWALRQGGFEEVTFCVPSGNLGNLTGGVLARLAGLPVRHFIAAHNTNDFFPEYLLGTNASFSPSRTTLSNAMDVGAPSNFERLTALLPDEQLRAWISGLSVTDEATLETMRAVFEETGYVADPHTAVGLDAARRYRARAGEEGPLVVLSTAHPAKFPETVHDALGIEPEPPPRLAELWERPVEVDTLAPTLEALRRALLHASH